MSLQKPIVVIGSTNTDMVIKTPRFPAPGETLLGGKFFMFPGGKGANQAVAAARLGASVTFVAKTGNDVFGERARVHFGAEGIDTRYVFNDPENASGVALITVDDAGENTIVVAQGANGALSPADLARATPALKTAAIILMQLEIPLQTVMAAAETAFVSGVKVILNPAPARDLPARLFPMLFMITPNRNEASRLTGISITDDASLERAARMLASFGVRHVVITLGADGAAIYDGGALVHVPAPVVKAIDTTAAGDVFNGAVAMAIAAGKPVGEAVGFGNRCAALSVTRMGAQTSAPYLHEIEIQSTSR